MLMILRVLLRMGLFSILEIPLGSYLKKKLPDTPFLEKILRHGYFAFFLSTASGSV